MKTMTNMLFSPAGAEAPGIGSIWPCLYDTVITGRFLKGNFS